MSKIQFKSSMHALIASAILYKSPGLHIWNPKQIVGKNGLFLKNLNLFKKLGKCASWCAMSWLQEMVKLYSRRSWTMSSWNRSATQLLMLAFNPYDCLSEYSHKITKDSNTEYLSGLIDSQPTNLNAYISHLKTSPIDK